MTAGSQANSILLTAIKGIPSLITGVGTVAAIWNQATTQNNIHQEAIKDRAYRHKLKAQENLFSGPRHREYSDCMEIIHGFIKRHGGYTKNPETGKYLFAEAFARMAEARDNTKVKREPVYDDFKEVNKCRSIAKDFWGAVYMLRKSDEVSSFELEDNVKHVLCDRYQPFKEAVQPLDDELKLGTNNFIYTMDEMLGCSEEPLRPS